MNTWVPNHGPRVTEHRWVLRTFLLCRGLLLTTLPGPGGHARVIVNTFGKNLEAS